MRLSCFGSEYKMAENWTHFKANHCLKTKQEEQEDNSTDDMNSSLSPKLPDKVMHYRDELNTDGHKQLF